MNNARIAATLIILVLGLALTASADVPFQMSYQGRLADTDGAPIDTTVDLTFIIFDDAVGTTPLWGETHLNVTTTDGLFDVILGSTNPLPDSIFDGQVRWLGIQIESGPVSSPLSPIVSVAYAVRSASADTADYAFASPGDEGGWTDDGTTVRLSAIDDSVGIGTTNPEARLEVDGDVLIGDRLTIGPGHTNDAAGSIVAGQYNNALADYSSVTGGSDNTTAGDRSHIGGGLFNYAEEAYTTVGGGKSDSAFLAYATVGGGWKNVAQGNNTTVGGGEANRALTAGSVIAGGASNTTEGAFSTIGGGYLNWTRANYTTIAGGNDNYAYGQYSTIAGGSNDSIINTGQYGFIGGGEFNMVAGTRGVVGGGAHHMMSGSYSAILGGYADTISGLASYSYLFGIGSRLSEDSTFMVDMPHVVFGDQSSGYEFPAARGSDGQVMVTDADGQLSWGNVTGSSGWVDDGINVRLSSVSDKVGIGTSTPDAKLEVDGDVLISGKITVGGNQTNSGVYSTISGGSDNLAEGTRSSVGGGRYNRARGDYSVVSGGGGITQVDSNSAIGDYSAIGGGTRNSASGTSSTVAGGQLNVAGSTGATVGGGASNLATGTLSTTAGGNFCRSRGSFSVVSGGGGSSQSDSNYASGISSTVPGGEGNGAVGDYSFAAGRRAKANHDGTFVWADHTDANFTSTGNDQFLIRAGGGVGIGVTAPDGLLEVGSNSDGVALHISNADNDVTWPSGQSLQFGEWDGATFQQRMRINSDGNVGVNTIAPNGQLHVRANADGIALHLSNATGDLTWPDDNTLNIGTWNGTVFDEHMRITAGGNVGIGVSSTPNILTIVQYSSTDPIADAWTTYSSKRWKMNIRPLENALEKVQRLRGVSFDWRKTGTPDIGLIAEEVGEVIPEVVAFEDNGVDAQSVDYARLVSVLIEAVKEQQEIINRQDASIEELRQQVDAIQTALGNQE